MGPCRTVRERALHGYFYLSTSGAEFWDPKRQVEQGDITVHVGGGQPDYYKGSVSTTVTVTDSSPLDSC